MEQSRPVTPSTAHSVMRNRAAVVEELRRLLPKMEALCTARSIPFGLPAIDRYLPQGGLAGSALHEVVPEPGATAAAFGFIVALLARVSMRSRFERSAHSACSPPPPGPRLRAPECMLVGEGLGKGVSSSKLRSPTPLPQGGREQINRQPIIVVMSARGLPDYGRPHGHGLRALGLDPGRLILVETAHRKETLWAMEEALHSRAPAAVAGVIDKLDLKTSQRLHLAATDCRLPLFLLRPAAPTLPSPACGGGWGEGSAAATRWRIGTLPAARDHFGLIARSRWRLTLERCRNGRAGEWMVEYDHVAHRFSLAAALADPARSRGAGEQAFRQAC